MGLDDDDQAGIEIVWKDLPFNALLAMLFLVTMLMVLVNPPQEEDASEEQTPGNVIVELVWDSGRNVDLDLWVQAPGDKPVGYSNKSGQVMNLLRDDLGKQGDLTDVNLENAYSRGIVEGEYCVNVHYFRDDGQGPINATVVIRVKESANAPTRQLLARDEMLMRAAGQELTAFRFKLTREGKLVDGSVHSIFKPLRSPENQPMRGR